MPLLCGERTGVFNGSRPSSRAKVAEQEFLRKTDANATSRLRFRFGGAAPTRSYSLLAYQPVRVRCATLSRIVNAEHHEVDQTLMNDATSNARLYAHDCKAQLRR